LVEAATRLIVELDVRFPKQVVLDAMGVIYPQYWLQVDAKMTFPQHLEVLKGFYCTPCPCGQSKDAPMIQPILSTWELDAH